MPTTSSAPRLAWLELNPSAWEGGIWMDGFYVPVVLLRSERHGWRISFNNPYEDAFSSQRNPQSLHACMERAQTLLNDAHTHWSKRHEGQALRAAGGDDYRAHYTSGS